MSSFLVLKICIVHVFQQPYNREAVADIMTLTYSIIHLHSLRPSSLTFSGMAGHASYVTSVEAKVAPKPVS